MLAQPGEGRRGLLSRGALSSFCWRPQCLSISGQTCCVTTQPLCPGPPARNRNPSQGPMPHSDPTQCERGRKRKQKKSPESLARLAEHVRVWGRLLPARLARHSLALRHLLEQGRLLRTPSALSPQISSHCYSSAATPAIHHTPPGSHPPALRRSTYGGRGVGGSGTGFGEGHILVL